MQVGGSRIHDDRLFMKSLSRSLMWVIRSPCKVLLQHCDGQGDQQKTVRENKSKHGRPNMCTLTTHNIRASRTQCLKVKECESLSKRAELTFNLFSGSRQR